VWLRTLSGISHAVFISYASQDAEAAKRICDALRAAGLEVWFDKSELRGGDVWDRQIRQQIHDCRLFMPIVSANTEARIEGYFRREWKLAVDRTHDLSERVAFLVPIVIDSTPEAKADVPDAFRHVQWTRLSGGNASPAFVERIRMLITPVPSSALPTATAHPEYRSAQISTTTNGPHRVARVALWALSGVVALGLAYFVADRFWLSKHGTDVHSVAKPADDSASNGGLPAATVATFNPPPHSIAVLPFINMSGDKEQEYFSDGLTEEILNSLARITQLQVTGRTSSFYFKGEHSDLATIARKLNVAALLEGSVRRSANRVRITTQLINASTGFHLWSQTYDRDLGDVLKLQSEIADAVAGALKVTLLGDIATKIELGGTRNPAAFDAYLRGAKALNNSVPNFKLLQTALASFTEAIGLDANYALALAGRSLALIDYSAYFVTGAAIPEGFAKALADARHALALAPELPEGQMALARIFAWGSLDFTQASEAWERAMSLAPGDARILREYGLFAAAMGRPDAGLAAARRAVVLDPLGPRSHFTLGQALFLAHRYPESVTAFNDALALEPDTADTYAWRGLAYYALADFDSARSSCESKSDAWVCLWCLTMVYDKLGRHADAEALLAKLTAAFGDAPAYQDAEIYAQRGNRTKALEWLEKALQVRDPGLAIMRVDPLLDSLRKEPRFQAIERELKFPPQ
jgi:TolB-like protein/cytochrome c-type biogenesis protein CcmH/NrfG